jgi:excinuclease ABC subunit B
MAYNVEHGITPMGVSKRIKNIIDGVYDAELSAQTLKAAEEAARYESMSEQELARQIKQLEKAMQTHAKNLEFEEAAAARDKLFHIKRLAFGGEIHDTAAAPGGAG